MIDNTLPQYQPDYVISWDFNKKDAACVTIARVHKDEKQGSLTAEMLGVSFETSGCVSLRQVLEAFEARERAEAARKEDRAELIKNFKDKEAQPNE